MAIYDRPTKTLMKDFAAEKLSGDKVFSKRDAEAWFAQNYPQIKAVTVRMHVEGMSVNSRSRKHHPNIRPGTGYDLFLKLGLDQYRLWNPENDPQPIYRDQILAEEQGHSTDELVEEEQELDVSEIEAREFAYENDLKNFLVRNLALVERGMRLYEAEGLRGVEFPAGGRFIDILAVDANGDFVVIELKVSRGYDRAIGQLLRYMGWIEENLADGRKVRGVIVASEITDDLKLAASRVGDIKLVEYQISFSLKKIN